MSDSREILALHADLLNTGQDQTEQFLARYQTAYPELRVLLRLAREIKTILVPMPVRNEFAAELRRQLLQADSPIVISGMEHSDRRMWVGAATVGSLLSLAGLLFWLRRHRGEPLVELGSS